MTSGRYQRDISPVEVAGPQWYEATALTQTYHAALIAWEWTEKPVGVVKRCWKNKPKKKGKKSHLRLLIRRKASLHFNELRCYTKARRGNVNGQRQEERKGNEREKLLVSAFVLSVEAASSEAEKIKKWRSVKKAHISVWGDCFHRSHATVEKRLLLQVAGDTKNRRHDCVCLQVAHISVFVLTTLKRRCC